MSPHRVETDPASGLPVSFRIEHAAPARRPERIPLEGRYCRLEPLDPRRHGDELFAASMAPGAEQRFAYLFDSPTSDRAAFQAWLEKAAASADPLHFAVIDKATGRVEGRQTLMRITPEHQVIEIGNILWGPAMSRTRLSTEANHLFALAAFERWGYRRYEWKCHSLNAPSRAAALRFGFRFEGIFKHHMITKGRNRDTAWFAITDDEWPQVKAATERWLAPANFDASGHQRLKLSALTASTLTAAGIALRRVELRDLDGILALQKAAYARNAEILGLTPLPLLADYRALLAEKEVWVLEADEGGVRSAGADPAGDTALSACLILEPGPDTLTLWSLATRPGAQGKGIGRALLAATEARARALDLKQLSLITGSPLRHLVAWYGRHGWRVAREEKLPDRSITHMAKQLG